MRILLITGPAGHTQGWGDMATTLRIRDVLSAMGATATVLYVQNADELSGELRTRTFDLVWSSLYYISSNIDFIGTNASGTWVHDLLDRMEIPYVGSGARSMKWMLDKAKTNAWLAQHGVDVPWQRIVEPGADRAPDVSFPAFVKPCFESESTGVAEESVVLSKAALHERIAYIHREFRQPALVEEYLPGREFTVSMLGNGATREFYAVENVINQAAYARFPVITKALKVEGWLDFRVPRRDLDRLHAQAAAAAAAIGCEDHTRIDVREDAHGRVKVIEVNGIPGLNPIKSRSLVIHGLYHGALAADDVFRLLIERIVGAALARHGLRAVEAPAADPRRSYPADIAAPPDMP